MGMVNYHVLFERTEEATLMPAAKIADGGRCEASLAKFKLYWR